MLRQQSDSMQAVILEMALALSDLNKSLVYQLGNNDIERQDMFLQKET